MSTLVAEFPTMADVLAVLEREAPSGSANGSRSHRPEDDWDMALGYDGAIAAYTGGWAEGAQRCYELAATLRPRPMSTRTTYRRDVAGSHANVGAFLAGAPNAMYRHARKSSAGRPFVHLVLSVAYAWDCKAEAAFNRGAATVALVDALESAGCRVRVSLVQVCTMMDHQQKYLAWYGVKGYGDRLDVDQLIFQAAHPAFFRRLIFAMMERSTIPEVRASHSYGYHNVELEPEDLPNDGQAIGVHFPMLTSDDNRKTPETFLAQMVGALPETLATTIVGE